MLQKQKTWRDLWKLDTAISVLSPCAQVDNAIKQVDNTKSFHEIPILKSPSRRDPGVKSRMCLRIPSVS